MIADRVGRYETVELIGSRATFVAPSGRTIEVAGFVDSEDGAVRRLRFCPTELGSYRYDADGSEGSFVVEPSGRRGFVRLDPAYPRHFVHDDGTHPFLAGKTAWVLGASPLWREFLDLCVANRQNVARFALGGLDFHASWMRARWWHESADGVVDLSRFNLPEWRQLDAAIRYGADRGILFEVCFYGNTAKTHGGVFPVPHPVMERFWEYTIARLAAFPNVLLWQTFNEFTGQSEYQRYMAEYLKTRDPYGRLVCGSGREVGDVPFPRERWNDLVVPHFCTGSHEELHDFYRGWALRLREHGKPVYVDETGRAAYGQGNYDGEHRRKQYWIWAVSGCYANFHSKGGCYVDLTREPGEEYWAYLVGFWQTTEWWRMEPIPDLICSAARAYAFASADEIVVYSYRTDNQIVEGGSLSLCIPAGRWWIHWYDPKNGCTVGVDTLEGGGDVALRMPTFHGDLALHLQRWSPERVHLASTPW